MWLRTDSLSFLILLALILKLCYKTSAKFRYYFKYLMIILAVGVIALVYLPLAFFTPFSHHNTLRAAPAYHLISLLVGIKWKIRGAQYLQVEEACVLVANHQSIVDTIGMAKLWTLGRKITAIVKHSLIYAFPFGLYLWLSEFIFVDRSRTESARKYLDQAMEKLKSEKMKLWVFPEGTRRNTGEIHEFKKGAFHIAIQGQIPIVPIVFSKNYFMCSKNKIFEDGVAVMTVLPPIPTVGLTLDDVELLLNETRNKMIAAFNAINKELLA